MNQPKKVKIKLIKAIRMKDEGRVEAGKVLEVDVQFAREMIANEKAIEFLDKKESAKGEPAK